MRGKTIAQVDRLRLIEAYKNNDDYVTVAKTLGIKRRTAYDVVLKFQRSGKTQVEHGGAPPVKLTNNILEALIQFIEEKPTATLQEMRSFLLADHDCNVSVSTIRGHLDGAFITIKQLRSIPKAWITDSVKEERCGFARWMMEEGVLKHLVFIDECGFNVWTSRTQGRSPRGSRAVRVVDCQRGQNLTLCMAVSSRLGLVHFSFVTGGMTQDCYAGFLSEVSTFLVDDPVVCLVHDNAPPHRNPPGLQSPSHDLVCLPRYSPFLNMVEYAISAVKSAAKRNLSNPNIQAQFGNRELAVQRGMSLHKLRLTILQSHVEEALAQVTPGKCNNWFGHTLSYMNACRERQTILC